MDATQTSSTAQAAKPWPSDFSQWLARALQPLPAAHLADDEGDDGADLALLAKPISRAPNAGAAVLA